MEFVNCRGWWSREVDLMLVMGLRRFVLLGLADEEVSMAGYVWYGRNRGDGRWTSDGVGVMVNWNLESRGVVHERDWRGWG